MFARKILPTNEKTEALLAEVDLNDCELIPSTICCLVSLTFLMIAKTESPL